MLSTLSLAAAKVAVLAADDPFVNKGKGILDGELGGPIKAIFGAIGVLIVIYALFKSLKDFAAGKIGNAVKAIAGGVLAAALCFDLTLPLTVVEKVGSLISKAVTAFGNLIG